MTSKITDPLIELLAIKLYEHDSIGGGSSTVLHEMATSDWPGWRQLIEEDRETYRKMARGEKLFYSEVE